MLFIFQHSSAGCFLLRPTSGPRWNNERAEILAPVHAIRTKERGPKHSSYTGIVQFSILICIIQQPYSPSYVYAPKFLTLRSLFRKFNFVVSHQSLPSSGGLAEWLTCCLRTTLYYSAHTLTKIFRNFKIAADRLGLLIFSTISAQFLIFLYS